jgi:hypothetical protein
VKGTAIRALYIVYHRGARGTRAEDSASDFITAVMKYVRDLKI